MFLSLRFANVKSASGDAPNVASESSIFLLPFWVDRESRFPQKIRCIFCTYIKSRKNHKFIIVSVANGPKIQWHSTPCAANVPKRDAVQPRPYYFINHVKPGVWSGRSYTIFLWFISAQNFILSSTSVASTVRSNFLITSHCTFSLLTVSVFIGEIKGLLINFLYYTP